MKISTKSWHYRWLSKLKIVQSRSLCVYLWQVVFSTTIFPGIALLILSAIVILALACLVGIFTVPLTLFGVVTLSPDGILAATLIFGTGSYALLVWNSGSYALKIYSRYKNRRYLSRDFVPVEDGLVVSYIKAKKAKICPFIDFTD